MESSATLTSLSPAQVNSYPVGVMDRTITGEEIDAKIKREKDDAFLQLARDRFKVCLDASDKQRQEMLVDLQFRCGIQWDPSVERERKAEGRPTHTVNRIPEFTKHVVNNMRQARPAIKVDPVGDGADQEQAEIRQGLIQYIERNSQSDVAADTAFDHMCIMGLGWMRVVDDWADIDSGDKDLFIRWVENPFTIYSDPTCMMPDWSDMKYAFVVEDIGQSEFVAKYGDKFLCTTPGPFSGIGDQKKNWFLPGSKIRVAEYFYIDYRKDTLLELSDGRWVFLSEADDAAKKAFLREEMKGSDVEQPAAAEDEVTLVSQQKRDVPEVWWSLITATDIIRKRRWKGRYIPLIPVIGNQYDLDGERILTGMVRYAREIQRMYNYVYSTLTEVIALTPKSQWIAEVDQIAPFRDLYEQANSRPMAALPYVGVQDGTGRPLPPPQRVSPIVEIQGLIQALQVIDNMLKSIFSIYDASLGQKGPQESGLAINARKIESDTSTYDWGDNFLRALRYMGRMIDDLLPAYYNRTGRLIQILREDQAMHTVVIGDVITDRKTKQPVLDDAGKPKILDLTSGKYSVVMNTGPSDQTKRETSARSMMEFAKAYPPLMQLAGDIIAREQNWPGKDAIANRLEKALPPGLQEPDPNAQGPDPQQMQMQLAQLQQMVQQLTQALHQATDKNVSEMQRATMKEVMATFRTEMQNETTRFVQMLKSGSDEAKYLNDILLNQENKVATAADSDLQQPTAQPAAPAPAPQGQQPTLAGPQASGGEQPSGGV